MKKLLMVLAIGAFAACNSGSGDGSTTDSTTMDTSTTVAPAMPDTSSMMSDTAHTMGDTSSLKTDSTRM